MLRTAGGALLAIRLRAKGLPGRSLRRQRPGVTAESRRAAHILPAVVRPSYPHSMGALRRSARGALVARGLTGRRLSWNTAQRLAWGAIGDLTCTAGILPDILRASCTQQPPGARRPHTAGETPALPFPPGPLGPCRAASSIGTSTISAVATPSASARWIKPPDMSADVRLIHRLP